MNITPNKLTIGQLFANQNEQFIIPAYQRRYAWKEVQVRAMFDDIDLLQENDNHLFGMLVFHAKTFIGGLNQPELVDGQQRITTLSILLMAIRKRFLELDKQEKAYEITKMLTSKGYDDIERNKVILGDLDNSDYSYLIKEKNFDQIKNQNLKNAYMSFYAWVSKRNLEQINKFFYKLINVAVVIRLDIGLAKDAYKLFETINNRGLKLSGTDLIKNFLFGHASQLGDHILEEIKDIWTEVITNLDDIDTDDFLRQYMCMLLTRKVSFTELVDDFKKHYFINVLESEQLVEYAQYVTAQRTSLFEEKESEEVDKDTVIVAKVEKISIIEFVEKIKFASLLYKKIINRAFEDERINRHLYNLERILSVPSYIFLMNLLGRFYSIVQIISVLKIIETFILRRHICEFRTGEHDDIFARLNRLCDQESILSIEVRVKNALQEHLPSNGLFVSSLPNHKFKGKLRGRAKYMLEQIEYYNFHHTGEFILSSSNEVHLEHIIPETITTKKAKKEFGDWETYLGVDAIELHPKYIHLIGNMTLLAGSLNISASNNPFLDKQLFYSKSKIQLTRMLATDYNNFVFKDVDERGQKLAEIALNIWTFKD